jgi:predicted dehydrogenase
MVAPALEEREPLQSVVEEFWRAIVERRAPLTDGNAGIRILRVLDAIDVSLRDDGHLVPLDAYR